MWPAASSCSHCSSANPFNPRAKISFPFFALLLSHTFVTTMRKATHSSYRCGRKMLQQLMLTDKTRTSLAWSCVTRLVLAYGNNEEVSEPLWSWVTNHFSKRWEPCAQQLPFCTTLAIKRHTENRAPPSVLVLERSFLSSSLWQADVRVNSSLPAWTRSPSISRVIP